LSTNQLLINRVIERSLAKDVALVSAGVALLVATAQLQIPFYPVPLTMQTLAVLLLAAGLGPVRGASSVLGYLALGAAGMPVFAGYKNLLMATTTWGYLLGFLAAAVVIGYLGSRWQLSSWFRVAVSFALGSVVIYLFGVSGLMISLGLQPIQAISAGVLPFLLGDIAKAVIAAALLPLAWKFAK
jgi:biotin transport system substrate-specific component